MVFGLDVMYLHSSQSQVSAELLLPVQHVMCYLNEVIPVQLLLQVREGTGREGRGIAWNKSVLQLVRMLQQLKQWALTIFGRRWSKVGGGG